MDQWLHHGEWLGNSALAWALAGAGALLGYLVIHGAAALFGTHLRKLAARTGRPGIEIAAATVEATRGWLLLLLAIAIALDFLRFTDRARPWLGHLIFTLVGLQVAFWISALIVAWLEHAARRNDAQRGNPVMLGVLIWGAQLVVWITLVLVLLGHAGVNISAFVASLGVGGVAVALALQNVLGDLFASISIGLDKPFEVGDSIAFDTESGTVTRVGIKSTRIRSQNGEELSISNSVLLKELIHNNSRMRERRAALTFRLPFETPRDKVPTVIERVRRIIENEKPVRFDRGWLSGFGECGLDFEFVYYVLDPDYNVFVEIWQRVNLAILAVFAELGVEFAVPVRSVRTTDAALAKAPAPQRDTT